MGGGGRGEGEGEGGKERERKEEGGNTVIASVNSREPECSSYVPSIRRLAVTQSRAICRYV